ncbi:Hsp20/alpha crystallin family protein [Halobellus ordinarius]|uniref:Hsp20/alpha crystallin family protein n=1 Tax=Halobellus ordinarius TaxID=3075120 RepID=UPI0028803099|nr:Hsp20/alpha crystallin family protein [Halobellus sp. ZY16]
MAKQTNPFKDLTQVFERMQEEFDEIARRWDSEELPMEPTTTSSIRIDLEDQDEELVLTAELPGFDSEDIDVRVTGQTLELEAEHEESEKEETSEYIRQERRRASAVRSVPLPVDIEAEDVSASYSNGVLTVRMPKSEPAAETTEIDID